MRLGVGEVLRRGGVFELAVAFIIGAAFATVIKTFTDVLMGFIGKIGGQPNFGKVTLAGVNVGLFINAVISFLIVAAVIYFFVVTPYNKIQQRISQGEEPAPPAADIALLTEIRDLLAGRPSMSTVEMDRGGAELTRG